jgi:hypothetical protein
MTASTPTTGQTSAEPEARCGWGYAGAVLGGLVSIAANVAHSFVPPTGAPADYRPPLGDVVGAVFWPIALFIAIEILARTTWPTGARWVVVRFLGLLPVALVAAIVSYNHLSGLLAHYHESALTAHLGPMAVDGLMIMSSAAVMATAAKRRDAADAKRTAVADTVSARPRKTADTKADSTADTNADTVSGPARTPKRTDTGRAVAALRAKHPEMTAAEMAKRLKVTDRTVRRYLSAPGEADPGTPNLATA